MKTYSHTSWNHRLDRLDRLAKSGLAMTALVSSFSLSLQAALPTPLVEMRFSEGSGDSTANSGSLGGSAAFVVADDYPIFATNVPNGVYAPAGNTSSLDFGNITDGQGGRAADLTASESDGTLGALNAFTICGWLNARNLNEGFGGNRIAFALASPDGPGFDLVQVGNGALRIGINQWPDGGNGGGPQSSAGAITADPQTAVGNWVFFSVTYDPGLTADNLKYYFGSPTTLAAPNSAHTYTGGIDNGGLVESTGLLTVGNFSDVVGARNETGPGGGSRVFRGLVDELRVYGSAFTLAEIQEAQVDGALPSVPATITSSPASQTVFAGQPVTFRVQASGTAPLAYQWQRDSADIPGATESSYSLPQSSATDNGAVFRVKVSNALAPDGVLSAPATLTVLEEDGHKVFLSFSEGGATVTNLGNLAGHGVYIASDGYPAASANVPTGAFAPTENSSSVDFGGIAEEQGGRAIDLVDGIDSTLGPMTAFTVTGWLNSSDLTEGFGGNRIAFALATPNGPGFDLVQVATGALRIGINQWPDAGSGGPFSSEGKITADPDTGAANWVFFATTYDSALETGNVTYFFGSPAQAAELDATLDYSRGALLQTGPLTVGNFSSVVGARTETGPGGGSRCFRGLIDELNVFNKVLTLTEIQSIQKAPAGKPTQPTSLTISVEGDQVLISWSSTGEFQLQKRAALGSGEGWTAETTAPVVNGDQKTVTLPIDGLTHFFRLMSQP